MVVGVNGAGKTTSIGKLTRRLQSEGKTVLLCAADTFRAAAIEQLEVWAQRTGADLIRQQPGSDPSAVVFDALTAASARKMDVRDRGHRRPPAHQDQPDGGARKDAPHGRSRDSRRAPHEVLLVLEATTGQNGLEQARKFTESSAVTGIILTKLDGTAKGGVVVAISRELNLPIRYVGVGEQIDDLLPFDPQTSLLHCSIENAMNRFMEEALELAARGVGRTSPNPAVGAVVVRDGEIVGRGFYTWAGVKHAEVLALEEAGDKSRGATMYVTLEPHRFTDARRRARTRSCARASQSRRADGRSQSAGQRPGVQATARGRHRSGNRLMRRPQRAELERGLRPFHAHRTAAGDVEGRTDAGREDRCPEDEDERSWITSETARAHVQNAAALHRRDSYRHRHRALRQLPSHRPHRPRSAPPAAAHRARFAAAPAAGFAPGSLVRSMMCWR